MNPDAKEFMRRFLLHVLPDGFMRIRHFRFLANRCTKKNLHRCRQPPGITPPLLRVKVKTPEEQMLELTGKDFTERPCCKKGRLTMVEKVPTAFAKYQNLNPIKYWDSS